MQIALKIKGKDKIFTTDFISARMVRRTIEVSQNTNFDNISVKELDTLVAFVVEIFEHQFTVDEVYDGLSSDKLFSTITCCIQEVTGSVEDVTAGDEKNG
ncbi:hypothetical protein PRVXT_002512 [Proteinivorax tanatarense]|uniref:Uncharacterized protein n=1 Tax=Proteinivorax tanatarense TaxID=1260629 RepID=A0AAU7VK37_9FIRM